MASEAGALPRWDMTTVLPSPDSPGFRRELAAVVAAIAELAALFDARGVDRREPAPLDDATAAAVEEVIDRYNAVLEAAMRLEGYLVCLVAADARDAAAQAAASEWRRQKTALARLAARFTAWIGSLDVEGLIARSAVARAHADLLRQLERAAGHLMTPAEEALAAALAPSGGAAWGRLRHDLEAQAVVRLELDGEERELSLSEAANLAFHPERAVRRRAFVAQRGLWQTPATPLAAALNGVKGEQLTLAARRGWAEPLDQALAANRIDRPILDALLGAIREARPDYRRYLRAKARLLGLPVLTWYDLAAPVGTPRAWPFAEAQDFIVARFGAYSPKLGALAARAFAERWIDAEPRRGKGGGAFCMPVGGDASRILANYLPVYEWMSGLAHELGHAYHNAVVAEYGRTMLQVPLPLPVPLPFPMTLAETASTFCEVLVRRAARERADAGEELAILDGWLLAVAWNVFAIDYLFAFERAVFAARGRRELSAAELDGLMLAAQRELFGDAVDPAALDPARWGAVPHYFLDDLLFYNFPYAFGLLFGLGLWARHEADPARLVAGFDELLATAGMADAAELAARFGIDLRSPGFWRESLNAVRTDVDRYEALAARAAPAAGGRDDG